MHSNSSYCNHLYLLHFKGKLKEAETECDKLKDELDFAVERVQQLEDELEDKRAILDEVSQEVDAIKHMHSVDNKQQE